MIKTDVLVIGAGPVGLFAVHQLGIIGLKAEVVDNLDKAGGQCIELYPDKPIYDIPAIPECTGEILTKNLLEQIKPFKTNFHLNERVEEILKEENNWKIKTNKSKIFIAPNIIIAGGVGSFEPSSDADITLIDLKKEQKVTSDLFGGFSDYLVYEGWKLKGWPVKTIIRGEIVSEDFQVIGKQGFGKLAPRTVKPI